VWEQAGISVVFAAVCFAGKVLAIQHYGIDALPWVTSLTYVLIVFVPYALLLPGIMRRLAPTE
jgi:hypothetical protein